MLLPAVFVAVMVKFVALITAVGVPEIFPLVGLNARPDGSAGEILQLVAGEPVLRGAIAVAATSLYIKYDVGEWEMFGKVATTARLKVVVAEPAAFVAVTVYVVAVETRVGVPVITPF